jgi:hypothetical protein
LDFPAPDQTVDIEDKRGGFVLSAELLTGKMLQLDGGGNVVG